ncbi:MAG: hypothetical protein V3R65_09920 [Acidiferrobacterales bacterium]
MSKANKTIVLIFAGLIILNCGMLVIAYQMYSYGNYGEAASLLSEAASLLSDESNSVNVNVTVKRETVVRLIESSDHMSYALFGFIFVLAITNIVILMIGAFLLRLTANKAPKRDGFAAAWLNR